MNAQRTATNTRPQTGVSYFANGWPHHFERDLDDMLAHGVTYVVHCFSENELVFARGRMQRFFRMTRDAGLGCWADPWSVLGLFGGEQFSAFVPRNPDACQILDTGQRAPAACPSAPETRAAMRLWIDAAIDLGADTLFWDEPHLYLPDWDDLAFAPETAWACRCVRCLDAYRARFGEAMPAVMTDSVQAFRQQLLVDFLAEAVAHAAARGARNAVCLLPVDDDAVESLPWLQVAGLPGVDIFGTDPYWYLHGHAWEPYVTAQTTRVLDVCAQTNCQPHIWVQGFGVPAGREAELDSALHHAAAMGVDWLACWGIHGNAAYDGASEQPEVVWETIGRAYRALRGME